MHSIERPSLATERLFRQPPHKVLTMVSRILFAVFTFPILSTSVLSAESTQRPNIIVFYSDDHGHADLGVYGLAGDVKTPHLDTLARNGVIATHGYTTAPQCVPSRGGLMTGRFQGRFNLDNNKSALDGFNRETTIASRLEKAGYVTAQFGKWHLGPTEEIPHHGFRFVYSQHSQSSFAANIDLDGREQPMKTVKPTMYHIDACSRAAVAVIDRHHQTPFFLYIAYRAPHTPLDAPEKYTSRFPGPMPERRRQALAMIAAMDDGVGLVVEALKKHNLTERTLLFFVGDNGAPLKIHKIDSPLDGDAGGWDGSLNTPLNGEKGMLSEGGISTPFVVAFPGTIPGGQIYHHPVSTLDIAATTAALANIPVQAGELDGVNLVPHLNGEKPNPPHEALFWRWVAQSAIREGNWKLLCGGKRQYLYDLSSDREEKINLIAEQPDVATRLRGKLKSWSDSLDPPGMALGEMSAIWNQYFDHYLEGKTIALGSEPSNATTVPGSEARGWIARGGILTFKDGIFELTPESGPKGKNLFIANSRLRLKAPTTVKLTLQAATAGKGSIAWRGAGDKDFLPEKRASFDITAQSTWEMHEIKLPASETVIHLRIHFPTGVTRFQEIEFTP